MLAEVMHVWLALYGAVWPQPSLALLAGPVIYNPATRAASNWRWQAISGLAVKPQTAIAFATAQEPARLPRCIRLNNYWCIKKAGWSGEVAADGEGHVAFASALEGAIVAVRLLRRYYVDYKRTSALAIVSRWAPAQCYRTSSTVRGPRGRRLRGNQRLRQIAPRGINRTLRARFLARHGRGGVAARSAKGRKASRSRIVRSRIPYRALPMLRAPSITPGGGERPQVIAPLAFADLPPARIRPERAVPRIGCTSEALRIRNYASKISAGLVRDGKADLNLFLPGGEPGRNLARVLANMAAVEIGPFRVERALIDAAIQAAAGPTLRSAQTPP